MVFWELCIWYFEIILCSIASWNTGVYCEFSLLCVVKGFRGECFTASYARLKTALHQIQILKEGTTSLLADFDLSRK